MTPEEAAKRVEIGHFVRKGYKPTGVIHVGANDGYEIQFYLALGCKPILAFEPLHSAFVKLYNTYSASGVLCYPFALGHYASFQVLNIAPGDGMGSTFLHEYSGQYEIVGKQLCPVFRFDHAFSTEYFNTLVVDVQGMELAVLEGFGSQLERLDFLNIECSRKPLYEGEADAEAVIAYLSAHRFVQDSPIEDHNDIKFIHARNLR